MSKFLLCRHWTLLRFGLQCNQNPFSLGVSIGCCTTRQLHQWEWCGRCRSDTYVSGSPCVRSIQMDYSLKLCQYSKKQKKQVSYTQFLGEIQYTHKILKSNERTRRWCVWKSKRWRRSTKFAATRFCVYWAPYPSFNQNFSHDFFDLVFSRCFRIRDVLKEQLHIYKKINIKRKVALLSSQPKLLILFTSAIKSFNKK